HPVHLHSFPTRRSSDLRHAAPEEAPAFPDGIVFVQLASVSEGEGIAPAIVEAAGVHVARNVPLLPQLLEYLSDRRMLLVLDNYEDRKSTRLNSSHVKIS